MINPNVIKETHKLATEYEKRFGKEIDCVGLPSTVSQEKFLQALRIIVDTGDSVLVGMTKVRDLIKPYFAYLTEYHNSHLDITNGFAFPKVCPLCGKKVFYYEFGNSYMYKCETEYCFIEQFRGL